MGKIIFIFLFIPFLSYSQGVWTQRANLPGPSRLDAFSFSVGNKAYVGAGADITLNGMQDVWEYDATSNSWLQKQNFAGGVRFQGVSFSIGTKGYFGTGEDNVSVFHGDFWEYDPVTDAWTQKANFGGAPRWRAVGFSIGNKGFVGTGTINTGNSCSDFWEYDPTSNSWTQRSNVPGGARFFATGFSINAKGYVGTGKDSLNTTNLKDFWEYDPLLNSWVQIPDFPGGKRVDVDGGHFVIGNYAYVGTGQNPDNVNYYNDFWRYDQTNNTWIPIPNLPSITRMGMSGFTINSIGYVCLGYSSSHTVQNDLWSFTDTTLFKFLLRSPQRKIIFLLLLPFHPMAMDKMIFYLYADKI